MHAQPGTLAVLIFTVLISWKAFTRHDLLERLMLSTDAILRRKQYERLVTSGFIHADAQHLLFNMFTFYFFSSGIERWYGTAPAMIIYFSGILGGGLLSLWLHRHHDYRMLEKVARNGIHSLTDKERDLLKKYSHRLKGRD